MRKLAFEIVIFILVITPSFASIIDSEEDDISMTDNPKHKLGEQLDIRQFTRDVDEPDWVEVLNEAYKEFEVWWRATTVEEMLLEEKRPNYDFEGRFIASINEKPVGIVHAHVDKMREEKKAA